MFVAHRIRTPGLSLLPLLAGLAYGAPLEAQDPDKIEIPASGQWHVSAVLTSPMPIATDEENFEFIVSPCGDSIVMIHPKGTILLEFLADRWAGSTQHDGGMVAVEILPGSRSQLVGAWAYAHPEVPMNMEWTLQYSLTGGDSPPENEGRGEYTVVTEKERRGLWVVEKAEYTAVVWDFDVNSAELLPRHTELLDEVIRILDLEGVPPCAPEKVTGFSRIEGFASQTGPERLNQRLARSRAGVVGEYLGANASYFSREENAARYWLGHPLGREGSWSDRPRDLPGLETSCNRAAAFTFAKEREYLEEPYAAEEPLRWLEQWLEGARNRPENEWSIERLRAKTRYVLAMNYLQMVKEGWCEPPEGSPADIFINGDYDSAEAALIAAYNEAAAADGNPYVMSTSHSGRARADDFWSRHLNPYYSYTYSSNDQARAAADGVEREIFGDNVSWGFEP